MYASSIDQTFEKEKTTHNIKIYLDVAFHAATGVLNRLVSSSSKTLLKWLFQPVPRCLAVLHLKPHTAARATNQWKDMMSSVHTHENLCIVIVWGGGWELLSFWSCWQSLQGKELHAPATVQGQCGIHIANELISGLFAILTPKHAGWPK